jgi:membrane-bound inhibitor of C-type lysozyme
MDIDTAAQQLAKARGRSMVVKVAYSLILPILAAGVACAQSAKPISTVRYVCDSGRSLTVAYYDGPVRTLPNGMPVAGGHVVLTLADGRTLTLQQTASGSGIRYVNPRETFVFWSKGDGAFVEEGPGQTMTYSNCQAQK